MSREAHMYILPRLYIIIKNEILMEKSRITSFLARKRFVVLDIVKL